MLSLFVNMLNRNNIKKIVNQLKYVICCWRSVNFQGIGKEILRSNYNVTLENIYGPTESTVYATSYSWKIEYYTINVPIGKPLSNINAYIIGKYNIVTTSRSCWGVMYCRKGVARGYLNRLESYNMKNLYKIHLY